MSLRRRRAGGAKRVVVKVGSSSLTTAKGGIDDARVVALVDALAAARQWRHRGCARVVRGDRRRALAARLQAARPRDLARQQAAASVGQGLLVHRYTDAFARHGITVGQVLLTLDDVTRRGHYRNAYRTFAKLLELGVLPVVNENDTVATTEIRFGDNDRLAALVAHLVHADALVLLSDIDGVYDRDPRLDGAAPPEVVRSEADLANVTLGPGSSLGFGRHDHQARGSPHRDRRWHPGCRWPAPIRSEPCWPASGVVHLVRTDGQAAVHPAAVARPRHRAKGRAGARPRCGSRRHHAGQFLATGRGHRRARVLRRGGAGRPRRRLRPRSCSGPRQLRLRRGSAAAGALHA